MTDGLASVMGSFNREGLDLSIQVDSLVTIMSEMKAAWRGLPLQLWRLKRKVRSFAAEVAVSIICSGTTACTI